MSALIIPFRNSSLRLTFHPHFFRGMQFLLGSSYLLTALTIFCFNGAAACLSFLLHSLLATIILLHLLAPIMLLAVYYGVHWRPVGHAPHSPSPQIEGGNILEPPSPILPMNRMLNFSSPTTEHLARLQTELAGTDVQPALSHTGSLFSPTPR